jgi:hypothetical protein
VDGANRWFWAARPDQLGPTQCRAINMSNVLGSGLIYSAGRLSLVRGMATGSSGIVQIPMIARSHSDMMARSVPR